MDAYVRVSVVLRSYPQLSTVLHRGANIGSRRPILSVGVSPFSSTVFSSIGGLWSTVCSVFVSVHSPNPLLLKSVPLFCFVLFCFVLFCFVLFCFVFLLSAVVYEFVGLCWYQSMFGGREAGGKLWCSQVYGSRDV